jgi:hypothetical protein
MHLPHFLLRPIPTVLLSALLPCQALAAPPADGFEQRCERQVLPRFEVSVRQPGFMVHNTVSARVLNTRSAFASAGAALLGMTASSTRADIDIDASGLSDPASGRECIAPRVTVELSYQPLDVYVARELRPTSCSYREVFAHEMLHVKIYVENLPRIEQRVRDELTSPYGGRPLYAPRNKGLSILSDQIDSWLRPLIQAELAQVEAQQRALDSHDENERLSHLCQGEVASLIGSSFQSVAAGAATARVSGSGCGGRS